MKMTEQQKEIKTIKPRKYSLQLSDADVERVAKKAGAYGLTVSELLENFIGDLVIGTYSNGGEERRYAKQWAESCWFAMNPDKSLIRYLCESGMYECGDVGGVIERIGEISEDIKSSFNSYMNGESYEWDEEVKKAQAWYKENIADK